MTPDRMIIIDVHACGVEAGENLDLMFEFEGTQKYAGYTVDEDLTIRVTFEEVSALFGEDLRSHAGERFYIESSYNGECWFGPIPASGDLLAELV